MTTVSEALSVLGDPNSRLAQILGALPLVEGSIDGPAVSIGISSNATAELLGTFLRRHAALQNTRLDVRMGAFDDLLGDVDAFVRDGVEYLLFLPFFDLLLPALEARIGADRAREFDDRIDEFAQRLALALAQADRFRTVFIGGAHRFGRTLDARSDEVAEAVRRCNSVLEAAAARHRNVRLVDMEEIVAEVGRQNAFDHRFYYRAKAPYTPALANCLAETVVRLTRGFGKYFYKVLALDCDNTMWGGIVGEDSLNGIRLDPHDYPGNVYWRVQNMFLAMERQGVLLCLCSKNNPRDVEEVLERHPHTAIRPENVTLKMVNWESKVDNLQAISRHLNVGLDSIVFLDDSAFECEAVRSLLPQVRTFQVPTALADYPRLVESIGALFAGHGVTDESRAKTAQYRIRAQAEAARADFGSQEEYLASLGIVVTISRNPLTSIPRISELTQKSNQFNLTTRRYSESDIEALIKSDASTVYSVAIEDRFGSAGLTGVLIVRWQQGVADIDSFLMSCRVLGRGIEMSIWQSVVNDARARSCTRLRAEYIPSSKNAQVADFFDRLGLARADVSPAGVRYAANLIDFTPPPTPWITVNDT